MNDDITPARLHGKRLVIIRPSETGIGYEPVAMGRLFHDGGSFWLEAQKGILPVGADDVASIAEVGPLNRVPACQGFDLFTVRR